MRAVWSVGLVLLLLSACGKQRVTSGFDNYVQDFEAVSHSFGPAVKVDDLIVEFANLPQPRTIAECVTETWKTPRIRIDPEKWENMSEGSRRLVVFHEMGHCVLDRRHRNDLLSTGAPASIMHQHNVPEELYEPERNYYLTELFQQRGTNARYLAQNSPNHRVPSRRSFNLAAPFESLVGPETVHEHESAPAHRCSLSLK